MSALNKLNTLVVSTELTLLSIVQGVALYFLTDSTRIAIETHAWGSLPYAATGLLAICTVWSRSVMHALTIVRWPIEFIHNFLYITITLIESLMFRAIGSPVEWFTLSFAMIVVIWLTYVCDLKMIDDGIYIMKKDDGHYASSILLYNAVRLDQVRKIRYMIPCAGALYGSLAVLCNVFWEPLSRGVHDTFIGNAFISNVFISIQFASLLIYLIMNIRNFRKLAPLVLAAADES